MSNPTDESSEDQGSVAVCTIPGGHYGSGKSSFYRALAPPGEFLNADVIEYLPRGNLVLQGWEERGLPWV